MTTYHSEIDQFFVALAHHRRRYVLAYLHQHHVLTLADLADEIAVDEYGMTLDGIPPDDVTEIYLDLYHSHIPKLADIDLVQYDQEQDLVTITDTGKTAHTWVENVLYDDNNILKMALSS